MGLVDGIIPEPLGGAHRNVHDTVYNVEQYLIKTLRDLKRVKIDNLLENRYKKLRSIGTAFRKVGRTVKAESKSVRKSKIPGRLSIKTQLSQARKTPAEQMAEATERE